MENRESVSSRITGAVEVMDPDRLILTCKSWTWWKFRALLMCLALAGFGKVRVSCAYRTFENQVKLYGAGRSADEMAEIGLSARYARPEDMRVTWLRPDSSRHVQGGAIDLDFSEYKVASLVVIPEICQQLGITWGGGWSVRDYSHFEI